MFTVFGAQGYVGSRLVARLRASGEDVFAVGRRDGVRLPGNLGHVVYAIGLTADFRRRPVDTMEAHAGLLAELLADVSFDSLTYLSSTRVYARAASAAPDALLPVDVCDPSDLYNISKLAGEALCLHCGRPGVKVVRLSNVVGPADVPSDNFVDSLVRDALRGRIALRSAPESAKDYIQLDDVVGLLPRIAIEGGARLYNLGSGFNLSNQAWIDRLVSLLQCEVDYQPDAPRLDFPTLDVSALRQEFSFVPRPPLDVLPDLVDSLSLHQQNNPS
jgi:nucleoside-diphosphate-sugar epimerase